MTTYRLVAYDEQGQAGESWDVQSLPMRADDVLVVRLAERLPYEEIEHLFAKLKKLMPNRQILITQSCISFFRLEQDDDTST